jgi:predicted AAA+ superfamily ATPase
MLYPRKILQPLKKHLKTKEIVVLTGMRRVGKTTAFRMIYKEIKSKNKVFLDIENPIEQKIFEEADYNNIWANLKPFGITNKEKAFIFLDEIQSAPEIIKAIKYLYDHYDVKFFLTGSSSFYLKNLFPESLAGRKFVLELYALDFEEFLIFKGQKKTFYKSFKEKEENKNAVGFEKYKKFYEEYLNYGGFPQVTLEESIDLKKEKLNDIFKSYFEKDVKILADFRDINAFRDLLLLLLERIGSKLDISKLSKEIGVSRETVYSYISFLQSTYFIELISPFSKSVDREMSGAKKIYLCDNGIVSQFSRVSEGNLLENAVYRNIRNRGEIRYYQKRSGQEIDFIIPQEKVAVEVKRKGFDKDLKKLKRLADDLELKESYIAAKEFNEEKGFIPALEI